LGVGRSRSHEKNQTEAGDEQRLEQPYNRIHIFTSQSKYRNSGSSAGNGLRAVAGFRVFAGDDLAECAAGVVTALSEICQKVVWSTANPLDTDEFLYLIKKPLRSEKKNVPDRRLEEGNRL
jgi:hypothetical protein